jgi:hypothetical protein
MKVEQFEAGLRVAGKIAFKRKPASVFRLGKYKNLACLSRKGSLVAFFFFEPQYRRRFRYEGDVATACRLSQSTPLCLPTTTENV